ncbi:hypothetical protein PIB30_032027 [Stylosanthes scabra]|uniref:RNase H type-1 domain-containing protein n=1 Tax=Stylosanthes scabra TaxID=79078 RepID=A0ABU6XCB1_9FABA|nr:hypothetical protein [Stylosanthes scabra]
MNFSLTVSSLSALVFTKMTSRSSLPTRPGTILYHRISELLKKNWQVRISHIYREANGYADWLANHSLNYDVSTQIWSCPPPGMNLNLVGDM